MDFSSKLLENAVQEISQLPGIGKRTALRLALHLLKQPPERSLSLSQAIIELREGVVFCSNVTISRILNYVKFVPVRNAIKN